MEEKLAQAQDGQAAALENVKAKDEELAELSKQKEGAMAGEFEALQKVGLWVWLAGWLAGWQF